MRFQQFTVTGQGPFPFDMLRYDCCWPKNVDDAAKLPDIDLRTITLLGTRPPAPGRWQAFGWLAAMNGKHERSAVRCIHCGTFFLKTNYAKHLPCPEDVGF